MKKVLAGLLVILFVAVSFAGCVGEDEIDLPADQLILSGDDFENNWTWTSW